MTAIFRYIVLITLFLYAQDSIYAQDNSTVNTMLAESDALITSGRLQEALDKTQQIIRYESDNVEALAKRINICFLMDNQKEALNYADDALKEHGDVAEFHYLRGIINNARGKYARALDDFSEAINLTPSSDLYKSYLGRGVSYLNLLEFESALADLTASIELNDTVASAYHSRAMVNYQTSDYAAAVEDFQKTLELSEGNAAIYFNLGMSYFRLNETDQACPYFNRACTMGNTNACRMTLMECTKTIPEVP